MSTYRLTRLIDNDCGPSEEVKTAVNFEHVSRIQEDSSGTMIWIRDISQPMHVKESFEMVSHVMGAHWIAENPGAPAASYS